MKILSKYPPEEKDNTNLYIGIAFGVTIGICLMAIILVNAANEVIRLSI